MGERLRRWGIATCAVLVGASVLAACTVSVPAGLLGALLSLAAFGALIASWSRSFERLIERGALAPDVAERLRRRPPHRG